MKLFKFFKKILIKDYNCALLRSVKQNTIIGGQLLFNTVRYSLIWSSEERKMTSMETGYLLLRQGGVAVGLMSRLSTQRIREASYLREGLQK